MECLFRNQNIAEWPIIISQNDTSFNIINKFENSYKLESVRNVESQKDVIFTNGHQ